MSAEEKKRALIDADVADGGQLTVKRVGAAIRMLRAGFFQEMTSGRRVNKLTTYDQSVLLAEEVEYHDDEITAAMMADTGEDEDQMVESLANDGDEDAVLVMDFEAAASEALQMDTEPAAAYTAYADARRRLSEKVRHRGFWPIAGRLGN